jgi:membrane protease YdiL (CAAX protease family)
LAGLSLGAAALGIVVAGVLGQGAHPALTWALGSLGMVAGLPLLRRHAGGWTGLGCGSAPGWAWQRSLPIAALAWAASACHGLGLAALMEIHDPNGLARFEAQYREIQNLGMPLMLLIVALLPATAEELFLRGPLQRGLERSWGPVAAVLLSTLLFAALHVSPWRMVAQTGLGLALGILAWRSGSAWPGVLVHALHNAGLILAEPWLSGATAHPVLTMGAGAVLGLVAAVVAAQPPPSGRGLGSPSDH